jgi:hypothetical protein
VHGQTRRLVDNHDVSAVKQDAKGEVVQIMTISKCV